jgi:hypothetical protein
MKETITALATVVAVGLTPTALAAEHPNDRGGLQGVAVAAEHHSTPTRPDDRPSVRGPDPAAVGSDAALAIRPDDRAGPRGPGLLNEQTPVSAPPDATVITPGAFDWADAAIGALGGLGAALIAAGLALAVARLRHYKHASA